jgi:tRNA dimethylallyltransferase
VTQPLVIVLGATGSGKTALSLALAQAFTGEIVSCDSVAVYRGMEIGTAKPSLEQRALVPHHMIDIADPDEACTAGDYSRRARESLAGIAERGHLPIVAGGTGLYLRALVDGLSPASPRNTRLRDLLRHRVETRGTLQLHRTLARFDPAAATSIHPHDIPKAIRAIEVSLAARLPMTQQWQQGREGLTGYRILRLGLDPSRAELYARINRRAAAMFEAGLVEETRLLVERYGPESRPLTSLGYAEACAVLRGDLTLDQAVAQAQQGHRNYAKRQMTWFRREPDVAWLQGCGDEPGIQAQAIEAVRTFLS